MSGGAGALGLLGLTGVIWSASGVMAAVRTALNVAWDTDAKRPFVRSKAVDLRLFPQSEGSAGTPADAAI